MRRKGIHAKSKSSVLKQSKNYNKKYRGQEDKIQKALETLQTDKRKYNNNLQNQKDKLTLIKPLY